jgi:hypothetical protein
MMKKQKRVGLCFGGPLNGERLAGAFYADKVIIPVNPHPPSEAYIKKYIEEGWTDPPPSLIFDQAEYRWAEGAWHYGVN